MRDSESMKAYADDLESLVLEHRQAIERLEDRLNGDRGNLDPDDLVRSQIEFLVLNVRGLMLGKEQELRQVRAELEYRRQMEADRGPWQETRPARMYPTEPAYPPLATTPGELFTRAAEYMGPVPAAAIARTVFAHHRNPAMVMICYRLNNGELLPIHNKAEKWDPSGEWDCIYETAIEGAQHAS